LITDNLLQEARDWAKLQLFGNADNNVKYCEAVKAAIIGMDHLCEFLYCDRRDVIRQLRATVVREELKRREDKKEPALERSETEEFIKNWLIETTECCTYYYQEGRTSIPTRSEGRPQSV
jgi:hypothetical protein